MQVKNALYVKFFLCCSSHVCFVIVLAVYYSFSNNASEKCTIIKLILRERKTHKEHRGASTTKEHSMQGDV